MEYDQDAVLAKRKQLTEYAALSPVGATLTAEDRLLVVNAFARITPPEEPEFTVGLITINSLYDSPKARSRKPGNLVLNWRRLLEVVPDVTLAGLGAASLPVAPHVAIALVGLYIWNKVWRGAVEEFSEIEAVTILALWSHQNSELKIAEPEGFKRVNELRANSSLPPLTAGQYASAINRLVQLECIKLENGVIWLRESIQVKF